MCAFFEEVGSFFSVLSSNYGSYFQVWIHEPIMPFAAVVEPESVEGAFLTEHPRHKDETNEVPWMTGVNSADGLVLALSMCHFGLSNLENFANFNNMEYFGNFTNFENIIRFGSYCDFFF